MQRRLKISLLAIVMALLTEGSMAPAGQRKEGPVERDFLNPPMAVRPGAFWAWLNGSVSLDRLTYELEEMKDKGMRGADIWDVRALRDPDKMIPAGPPFLGEESLQAISHAVRQADRLGLSLGMVAASGWNAGGPWVTPKDAGMGLFHSELTVEGPAALARELPFPEVPKNCPKNPDGRPAYYKDVAVFAWPKQDGRNDLPAVLFRSSI